MGTQHHHLRWLTFSFQTKKWAVPGGIRTHITVSFRSVLLPLSHRVSSLVVGHICIYIQYIIMSLQEVDVQLKLVCEKFISDISASLTAPLKSLLSKCDVIFQLAEKDNLDPSNILHQQPFARAGTNTYQVWVGRSVLTLSYYVLSHIWS